MVPGNEKCGSIEMVVLDRSELELSLSLSLYIYIYGFMINIIIALFMYVLVVVTIIVVCTLEAQLLLELRGHHVVLVAILYYHIL